MLSWWGKYVLWVIAPSHYYSIPSHIESKYSMCIFVVVFFKGLLFFGRAVKNILKLTPESAKISGFLMGILQESTNIQNIS